jgi:hypothetical protein
MDGWTHRERFSITFYISLLMQKFLKRTFNPSMCPEFAGAERR